MPEGLEAEIWRRACGSLVGRSIERVEIDPRVAPDDLVDRVTGTVIEGVRRRGKVLLVDTDGPTIGLHFGMTGRLVVDGDAPIERLEYASGADRPDWDRLRLWTGPATGPPALRLNDPRRLGHVSLDPALSHLGPDALTLTAGELARSIRGRTRAIKALLLDQAVVAGLGNLCADEVLFHAGVSPLRPADELSTDEVDALAAACRRRLPEMLERGGSTTGTLDPERRSRLGPCPTGDGGHLDRSTVGGRTAVWCHAHQR